VNPVPARITAVTATPLRFPLAPPFRAAVRRLDSVEPVLVRVRDDQGREGTATAFGFGAADARPIVELVRSLGETRIGQPALGTERHWGEMHQLLALAGVGGAGLAALSAIDLALWDLAGRTLEAPLWRLLGGAREQVGVYASGGSLALSTDALVAEALRFAEAGHRALKLKAGLGTQHDRERLLAVRQAAGAGFALAADGNQQWDAKAAIRWARTMQDLDLAWLEEPVRADDLRAHAEVRSAIPMDLATGETLFGVDAAHRAIQGHACDILMPNLQRVGGISGWRKVAAAAELAGLRVAGHVYPEFHLHLLCATPNVAALPLELWPGWPWPWQEPLRVQDGQARPPDAPGHGFTLDEGRVRAHRSDA
jgi:L-alanine-DL-glutamate epimerase-like enolase superfamily enzyme